jgi:hypothetical protein
LADTDRDWGRRNQRLTAKGGANLDDTVLERSCDTDDGHPGGGEEGDGGNGCDHGLILRYGA